MRCGEPTEDAQLCPNCIAEKRAAEEERSRLAAENVAARSENTPASNAACPSCGNFISSGANFCLWCRKQLRDDVPLEFRQVDYGGFWIRFAATFIDGLIIGAIQFAVSIFVFNGFGGLFLSWVIPAAYTLGFWLSQGATPGKMAFGLRIVTTDRDPITFSHAIVRYLVTGFTLGLCYLVIPFSPEKRGLHDYIAGTIVIRVPQQVRAGTRTVRGGAGERSLP